MGNHSIIITFLGDDRPGLVRELSQVISKHGGNWLESRMSKMAGKFVGIVRVEVATDNIEGMRSALQQYSSPELTLNIENASGDTATSDREHHILKVIGQDRTGIVHEISGALAAQQINVLEMSTDVTSAPMTAEPLFSATAEISIPEGIDHLALEEQLEQIADELGIEVNLETAPV